MTVLLKMQHTLPTLPLDRPVPNCALRRRGGVSFSSCDVNHSCDLVALQKKRRCGISYESKDTDAEYVRMLGDVKVGVAGGSLQQQAHHSETESAEVEKDRTKLEHNQYKIQRFSLRYASLHKTRRKPRPIFKVHDTASVLDTHYDGPTWCLLSRVGDWEFDIFNLDKLSNGRTLFNVGLHLFQEHNLIETFQLDIMKLMRCISLIEEGYHSANPYHNAVHAADVAQAMHCYLLEKRVSHYITPLETLTAIMAALAHDLDHPGVNQAFLIATSNHLAALYNNTSVLENHHWRTAIGVFHESGVFDHFSDSMWKTIEWQMKSLILATDITRQVEFLSKFKVIIDNNELDMTSEDHRHFMLQIGLKCADICNPCRVWEISRKWSELVCDEFFKQGDYERKLLLPVTPLCDRNGTTVAKIQSGFMQFVVLPLFEEWYRFSPTKLSQVMLDNLKSNKHNWDEIMKQDQAKKAKEEQEINVIPEENEDLNSSSCSSSKESEKESPDEEEDTTNQSEAPRQIVTGGGGRTPCVSESEKENSDPHQEEISSVTGSDVIDDDDMEMPLYFARRHSLPVSTGWKPSEHIKAVIPEKKPGWPVMPSAGRRHSLPTPQLLPITSFEKLTERLFSVKEDSPASSAFEFDRWGTRIPHVSLNSSTLMNVSLEANKLTDAHGLNQVMLQRRYQSEPHVTQSSGGGSSKSTSAGAGKLAQSPSANLHSLRASSPKTVRPEAGHNLHQHLHHNSSSNSEGKQQYLPHNINNRMLTDTQQSPHTFHSNHSGLANNCNTGSGLRRASLNSPQRNNSVLPNNNSFVQNAASSAAAATTLVPRRASLGDKPHHSSSPSTTSDVEAQPLLPKCANAGDQYDQYEDEAPLDTTTSPTCYFNSAAIPLSPTGSCGSDAQDSPNTTASAPTTTSQESMHRLRTVVNSVPP